MKTKGMEMADSSVFSDDVINKNMMFFLGKILYDVTKQSDSEVK